jgi:hypothetical protein
VRTWLAGRTVASWSSWLSMRQKYNSSTELDTAWYQNDFLNMLNTLPKHNYILMSHSSSFQTNPEITLEKFHNKFLPHSYRVTSHKPSSRLIRCCTTFSLNWCDIVKLAIIQPMSTIFWAKSALSRAVKHNVPTNYDQFCTKISN